MLWNESDVLTESVALALNNGHYQVQLWATQINCSAGLDTFGTENPKHNYIHNGQWIHHCIVHQSNFLENSEM